MRRAMGYGPRHGRLGDHAAVAVLAIATLAGWWGWTGVAILVGALALRMVLNVLEPQAVRRAGGALCLAVALAWAVPASAAPSKPRPVIAGLVTAVGDGDALRVALRWVRAARYDAPEQAAGNKAWPEQPGAIGAREALAALVLGRRVACEVVGESYGRPVGACTRDDGLDVSAEMVRLGWGWADPENRGRPLLPAEAEARAAGLGIWRDAAAVPPWCWRRPWARRCARIVVDHGEGG